MHEHQRDLRGVVKPPACLRQRLLPLLSYSPWHRWLQVVNMCSWSVLHIPHLGERSDVLQLAPAWPVRFETRPPCPGPQGHEDARLSPVLPREDGHWAILRSGYPVHVSHVGGAWGLAVDWRTDPTLLQCAGRARSLQSYPCQCRRLNTS